MSGCVIKSKRCMVNWSVVDFRENWGEIIQFLFDQAVSLGLILTRVIS